MTIRAMNRNPNADSAGPASPIATFAVAGSRSPSTIIAADPWYSWAAWHGRAAVLLLTAAAMPAASLLGAPPLLLPSGRRVSGWFCSIGKRK
jgi:hypothetical protein